MPSKKWTYETCKQIASEFTTLKEFRSQFPAAYAAAKKNGWTNDFDWLTTRNNNGYWTYERCYEVAKKYTTISEFAKGCGSAHFRAKRNGWIKDYDWFVNGKILLAKKRTIWTYDTCYELAKQCYKKSEMKTKNIRAYQVALKNGWFSDYTWFLSNDVIRHQKRPYRVKWTYERCRDAAIKFNVLAEFSKAFPSAYTISNRNGWIDDFDWLERSGNIYTSQVDNVYAYFFNEFNSVYIGRTVDPSSRDFGHNNNPQSSVFRFASINNIPIPEMTILERGLTIIDGLDREDYYRNKYEIEGWNVLNIAKTGKKSGSLGGLGSGKWNYKSCYKEAKKYRTLKEFRENAPATYNVVCKHGWQNEYHWLNVNTHKPGYWTYERCYEEAKKYSTRKKFQSGNHSAYTKSSKEKWINDYVWFSPSASMLKWDYDGCYNAAKNYNTLSDFRQNCGRAYSVARKNNWLIDYDWLTKKDISPKAVLQFSLDGMLIARYNGVREASRINGFSNACISACCNGKLNHHKGFIWKYENHIKKEVSNPIVQEVPTPAH